MVQEFRVLRCYSCHVFQVHQVKKSKKWACKLCGEKQSLLKVYGQGSGADCRHHVQKLNRLQGQAEQAATGTDGETRPSAASDEDIGGESNQSLMASQEDAPRSRWEKYVQETGDEEEGGIPTAHEHYYSHQEGSPRTLRKRLHSPYNEGDLYKEDKKENVSKKMKIFQNENPLEINPSSCRISADVGWQDNPASHTFPLHSSTEALLPMNTSQGRFKRTICNTASCLKREPKMDPHFEHRNTFGPDCFRASSQDVLPNNEPSPTSELPAPVSSPGSRLAGADLRAGVIPTASAIPTASVIPTASSLQKPIIQANLFQTDEDFDDDY